MPFSGTQSPARSCLQSQRHLLQGGLEKKGPGIKEGREKESSGVRPQCPGPAAPCVAARRRAGSQEEGDAQGKGAAADTSLHPFPSPMDPGQMSRGMQAQALPRPTPWGCCSPSWRGGNQPLQHPQGSLVWHSLVWKGEFPSRGREGSCASETVGEMQLLVPPGLQRACVSRVVNQPHGKVTSRGFAGSSDHVHQLQEKAGSDLNPLPALGRGTRATFTMQMNQLSLGVCSPLPSSAGKGIIAAGLLSEQVWVQGESRAAAFKAASGWVSLAVFQPRL